MKEMFMYNDHGLVEGREYIYKIGSRTVNSRESQWLLNLACTEKLGEHTVRRIREVYVQSGCEWRSRFSGEGPLL